MTSIDDKPPIEPTRRVRLPAQEVPNPFAPTTQAKQAERAGTTRTEDHAREARNAENASNPCSKCNSRAQGKAACARTVEIHKVATTLRELDVVEDHLTFELGRTLGKTTFAAAGSDAALPRTAVHAARCASSHAPELQRCAVKVTSSRELAENEWYHLTTYRSPVFPTPFLFGRVAGRVTEGAADESAADARAIVMELIEGPTLQEMIDAGFGDDRGPAPVEKALEIMSPLAASFKVLSLSFQGFVHRDIKPANIVVSATGACKTRLLDLGISAHEQDRLQHIHAGATPGFAPLELEKPELYPSGAHVSYCDSRIDAYSLAATLYALLTGHAPRTYGTTLHASELRHDAAVIEHVRDVARRNIKSKHDRSIDDTHLDELVERAVYAADEHLAHLVSRGLSRLQEDRPTPAAFFDELPAKYVSSLVDAIQLGYLESLLTPSQAQPTTSARHEHLRTVGLAANERTSLGDTPLSDDYRYDGFLDDFRTAIDSWNLGDYATAAPLFKKLDAAGDQTAQYNLGICYRDGLGGIEPDPTQMLACWTKAAEAGNVVAAYNVAVCHEVGNGVPIMPDAAEMWYRRSARGGFPPAIKWLKTHSTPSA